MRPFDLVRAAFLLVAFVIVAHIVLVFIVAGFCVYEWRDIAKVPQAFAACTEGKMAEVLAAALAAALAFASGKLHRDDSNDKSDSK